MTIKEEVLQRARRAKLASRKLANLPTGVKNGALLRMARALEERSDDVMEANARDIASARARGVSSAFLDRLTLNQARIEGMVQGLRQVASLPDPVGEIISSQVRPNGLKVEKVRVPLGVIGIIYESRPNVTADAAGLALKAGNAVILRGGSDAINSNVILAQILCQASSEAGIPDHAIQLIETTDRKAVYELLKLDGYLEAVIPRGGPELIELVRKNSTIPVIAHGKGLCHVYVDEAADLRMALDVVLNAKVQRPGVCNAVETLLVHSRVAQDFLPHVCDRLIKAGVEIKGDPKVCQIIPQALKASELDWETEYLDLILAVRVVSSLDEALGHISQYGSGHSEAIITSDQASAERFLREVDAAAVYVNASTRFTDGGEFGLGAELGISTQKLHARGPMGLQELTSYKYIIYGDGQVRG